MQIESSVRPRCKRRRCLRESHALFANENPPPPPLSPPPPPPPYPPPPSIYLHGSATSRRGGGGSRQKWEMEDNGICKFDFHLDMPVVGRYYSQMCFNLRLLQLLSYSR